MERHSRIQRVAQLLVEKYQGGGAAPGGASDRTSAAAGGRGGWPLGQLARRGTAEAASQIGAFSSAAGSPLWQAAAGPHGWQRYFVVFSLEPQPHSVRFMPDRAEARVVERPARILFVEDDPDVRPMVERALLTEGYRVDVAATYAGAIERLNADTVYDLVLTDGRLDDGSGIDIADRGKARGAKTLVMTGYALHFLPEDLARHLYIWKPVRGPELLAVVARLLKGEA